MREIIFRGKRKDNGEWVYGNLVKSGTLSFISEDEVIICAKNTVRGILTQPREVIPETVGQYTGACDKNGNKYFEGDIVRWETTRGQFLEGSVFFDQNSCCYGIRANDYAGSHRVNLFLSNEFTIVGNVHGNSGLEKLKPCPFCGKTESVWVGAANQIDESSKDNESFAVNCNHQKGGCGATGGYMETKDEAIKEWNTRVE